MNFDFPVYPFSRIYSNKKGTMHIIIHVVPFYCYKFLKMGIHKKYSIVYQYFKFVAIYKKGTMCLFIHIISMYTHILKFMAINRNYVSFIHIISMYTHILTIKRKLCE